MAYFITVREGAEPEFKFEFTDETRFDQNRRVELPFYNWIGSPRVEDTSCIPKSAIQTGRGVGKADALWIESRAGVVSERFKDIIERFEPGVHQFFPITLKRRNGEPYAEKFFLFHVTQRVACVLREASGRVRVGRVKAGPETGAPYYSIHDDEMVISRPAIGARQVFSALAIGAGKLIVSDAIGDCLRKERIRNLRMHPVGESDRPWLPEENVPEMLAFDEEHPELRASFDPL